MKILQVITSLRIGGAEKLIVDMVPLYRERGYDVDVLLFDGIDTSFKQQLLAKGVKIYETGRACSVYHPKHLFKLISLMRRYDIVHTHNTAPQLFAAIGSLFNSAILCTTEHSTSNRRRSWLLYAMVDRWMYSRYQSVICISDQAKENLVQYLRNNRNVSTIYNGVDLENFRQAEAHLELRDGKKVIIMVAGFRQEKDQDTLIRAMRHLPADEYELWLVGDGERREVLCNLVKQEKLDDVVRFWGNRSDIPILLKSSDVVVMSSHYEGLSLSSIEGMSVGKPFIASDVDGLREITSGAGLLFPHEDDEALSALIRRVTTDAGFYRQVAENCAERAAKYDIHKTVDQYLEIYNSLGKE